MHNPFRKTQKITFTSNKVTVIDVVHHLHPCEGQGQGGLRQGVLLPGLPRMLWEPGRPWD